MKKLLIALALAAFALPVAAQEGPPPGPFVDEAFRGVAAFLQLDESQAAAWTALLEDRGAAARPLHDAAAAVQAELEALLATADPDPTAVGELVLERRSLGEQLAEVNQTYVAGFEALLSEDQTARLGFVRRAARVRPVIPAFERMGLLAPPPGGDQPPPQL